MEQALALAEKIAAGEEGKGSLPVPNAEKVLMCFRRYLAEQAVKRNVVEKYRQGFLRRTDYFGEYRAWEAAEMYRKFVADLMANPATVTDAPRIWNAILGILQDARQFTDDNKDLQQRLDRDIAAVQTYLGQPQATRRRLPMPGTRRRIAPTPPRARRIGTRRRRRGGASWAMLQGRPAADRTEAALRIVTPAHERRQTSSSRRVTRTPRARPSNRPARPSVTARTASGRRARCGPGRDHERLENNLRALGAGEEKLVAARPGQHRRLHAAGRSARAARGASSSTTTSSTSPDVTDWLNRLQSNPDAVKRLVDWFNNGPLAAKTPDAKRDFSADPNSPNYLVTFLSKHVHRHSRHPAPRRRPVVRPQRRRPLAGLPGACRHGGLLPRRMALPSSMPTVRTRWPDPGSKTPGEFMTLPRAGHREAVPAVPAGRLRHPRGGFAIHIEGIFQPYALPNPFVAPLPVIPPALRVLWSRRPSRRWLGRSEKGHPSYEKGEEEEKGGKSEPLPKDLRKPQ